MKEEKFFTQQWFFADEAKIIEKSTLIYPEFDVHYQEIEWHEDGDLVKIRLTFRNCGRNLYTQRLVKFLIKAFYGQRNSSND
jgi:hypothetical protein